MKIDFIDLGLREFKEVENIQKDFLEKRKKGLCGDVILCTEFYPVITLGRNGSWEEILLDEKRRREEGIPIYRVNRGGGVTLHLPGQLVLYPIWKLSEWKKDIGFYLRLIQDWVIRFLSFFKIEGRKEKNLAGVWVKDKKISFFGIGISQWVTFHGLSININPDLRLFRYIIPCGIRDLRVTSLYEELNYLPSEKELKRVLLLSLGEIIREEDFPHEVSLLS